MYFLGIETSCDETAAAVFTEELQVLSSVVASQNDLHARFHGVVPEIAARAHLRNLLPVIDQALRQANVTLADIGCVAVHNTPGLVGALLVGVSAAKMLALAQRVPLIAVNHIASHIYACRLAAGREIFTIRDLTKEFAVSARTLRFYEEKGLLAPRRNGEQRLYSRRDRARLRYVLMGKRVGFSLEEVREMLDLYDLGDGRRTQLQVALAKFQ